MFTIEKGIAPPDASRSTGGRPEKYPWSSLEVGDSFLTDNQEIRVSASQWKRRHPGWEYRSRKEGAGVRIWRIA